MKLPYDYYCDNEHTPPKIDDKSKEKIKKFIENKTDGLYLFDEQLNSNIKIEISSEFRKAIYFHDNGEVESTKNELETLANKFINNKDYINYLIAIFNINNLPGNKFNKIFSNGNDENIKNDSKTQKDSKETQGFYLGDDFKHIVNNIIRLSTYNERKVLIFLRDEIFSFKYLYRKQIIVFNLYRKIKFDWLKSKDRNASHFHYDSNLEKLRDEIISLNYFYDGNGILIKHFKEFKNIVNIYFEALIYSYDLSKVENDRMYFSSKIDCFGKKDVEYIFKYIDQKYFKSFIEKNGIPKIIISEEAYNYLINEIIKLLNYSNTSKITLNQLQYLNNYIFALKYICIYDYNRIIEVLQNIKIFNTNFLEVNNIIIKLVEDNIEKISNENIEKLHFILNNNLDKLYETNKDSFKMGYSNYGHYIYAVSSIINYINSKTNKNIEIKIDSIEDSLYLIKDGRKDIKEILSINYYLTTLKQNISEESSKLVDDILQKYAEESEDIDIEFVSMMIITGNHNFDCHIESVYNKFIEILNRVYPEGVMVENSYKYLAIDRLYGFYSEKLIDKSRILKDINKDCVRGINARFDWFILDDYNFDNIERLIDLFGVESFKNNYLKSQKERKAYECYKDHLVEEKFKL